MNNKKKFNSVEMMRKLRDNLSKELKNKSFEEQKKILKSKLEKKKTLSSDFKRSHNSLKVKV
jgi:hypothetical protein